MKFILAVILLVALVGTSLGHVVMKRSADSRCDAQPCTVPQAGISCAALFRHYTYLKDSNLCVQFIFGECGGTTNNFESQVECETTCQQ